jgi:hypothetical protein
VRGGGRGGEDRRAGLEGEERTEGRDWKEGEDRRAGLEGRGREGEGACGTGKEWEERRAAGGYWRSEGLRYVAW